MIVFFFTLKRVINLSHLSGVNFINMFTHSVYVCRSKKLHDLTVFLRFWRSACVKAARKISVKLTPVLRSACFNAFKYLIIFGVSLTRLLV